MESARSRLGELEKSYSDLAQSLHRPTNVRYTELCQLRQQANRQRWICWESDATGLEVEVAMLSGRSWTFIIGNTAKGVEVKERLAELSGIHQTELSLVCNGRRIRDDEVLLPTFFSELAGPPPQLQLLRIFRPFALTCSTDCTLKIWDMDRAECVQTLRGHGDGVMSVAVDWKSRYAVSGAHVRYPGSMRVIGCCETRLFIGVLFDCQVELFVSCLHDIMLCSVCIVSTDAK
eukprot:s4937_g1.t1